MTWAASIVGKQQNIGYEEFAVRYTDGSRSRDELIRISDGDIDTLKKAIASMLTRLAQVDTLDAAVPPGPFDPTITPPEPDAAEVAYQTWLRNLSRLRKVNELITLGVLVGDEAAVVNLRNTVRTTFLVSYLNRF